MKQGVLMFGVLLVMSGCPTPSAQCDSGLCDVDAGGGGGGSAAGGGAGGGSATGGGPATGGGDATGGGASTGGGSAMGGGSATGGGSGSGDITGHCMRTWKFEDGGATVLPHDISGFTIGAWASSSVDGGVVYYPGVGSTNGLFAVPNVPPGSYIFRFQDQHFVTSSRALDMDFATPGRPNVVYPSTNPTPLSFQLSGLSPWTPSDSIQMLSFGPSAQVSLSPSPMPTVGTTTVSGVINYQATAAPLIQASRGDSAYLVQNTLRGDAGMYIVSPSRALVVSNLEMADGQTSSVTQSMSALPDVNLNLSYQAADAVALYGQLNPAQPQFLMLAGFADPQGMAAGTQARVELFRLVAYAPYVPPSSITIGYPVPTAWPTVGYAEWGVEVPRALGSAQARNFRSGTQVLMNGPDLISQPIRPPLGPVRQPKINAVDLLVDQSGVGLTPTLSWSAPTIGTAQRYFVEVSQLSVVGGTTQVALTRSIDTAQTSLTLPLSWMVPGEAYVIRISANQSSSAVDPAFYRRELPYATSAIVSGVIRP